MKFRPLPQPQFSSPLHHPRVAVVIGRWLGAAVLVCFLTGVFSHVQQETTYVPSRPVSLYRVTQGLHVLSGTIAIPLLLAKLWTVYPKLFAKPPWPPSRQALVSIVERLSILVLVATLALELLTGFLNTIQWYPWPFPFRETHYALAWIIVGALIVHLAVKLPLIVEHWRKVRAAPRQDGLSRRGLFRIVAGAGALVGVTTVGQSVPPLGPLAVLAPRRPGVGPQGLPVNRTAEAAGVVRADSEWRLTIVGPRELSFTLDELRRLPQTQADLPIACVEGWSQGARWEGIRIRDLLSLCGAAKSAGVRVRSLEKGGFYGTSELPAQFAQDPLTLLALRLNGADLDLDHGYPARIIAPNRPGVLQTKWVHRLEVLS
ncbi:DMSO/TMAO reductase YedYZ molybdopterin-dependent catalytic subunit [Kribbella amoyensis]|uniref:DMSO/TMAO reductase YedYZ molybdopterin-dependent catalytic subunit n=1 Tax=Kribbella amoyensis TaxID=996641 RepID=A0A561C0F7_9ACTN|nr:molybdopterin-dependent oxidoreductase [Kribbella amoyensis]TWD84537.1 DMSO/TMAO reductase YedYZ molybdopterin-dependent catalytic subunit [Kribbella amoyensis]